MGESLISISITMPQQSWLDAILNMANGDCYICTDSKEWLNLFSSALVLEAGLREGVELAIVHCGASSILSQLNRTLVTPNEVHCSSLGVQEILLNFETEPQHRLLLWHDMSSLIESNEESFSALITSAVDAGYQNRFGLAAVKTDGKPYLVNQRNIFFFANHDSKFVKSKLEAIFGMDSIILTSLTQVALRFDEMGLSSKLPTISESFVDSRIPIGRMRTVLIKIDEPIGKWIMTLQTEPESDWIILNEDPDHVIWFVTNLTQMLAVQEGQVAVPVFCEESLSLSDVYHQLCRIYPCDSQKETSIDSIVEILVGPDTPRHGRLNVWHDVRCLFFNGVEEGDRVLSAAMIASQIRRKKRRLEADHGADGRRHDRNLFVFSKCGEHFAKEMVLDAWQESCMRLGEEIPFPVCLRLVSEEMDDFLQA